MVTYILFVSGETVGEGQIMEWTDGTPHDVSAVAVSGYQNEADFYFYNDSTSVTSHRLAFSRASGLHIV